MEEHRLTGTIGAEITGIDLRQPISDDLAEALRHALARHQVLFLRDQHLSSISSRPSRAPSGR